jgi:hypothetical protein
LGAIPQAPRDQAWAALAEALRRGWEIRAIASATGLPRDTVNTIVIGYRAHGPVAHLNRATVHALAEMGEPTEGKVGAYSTVRRLRALARAGWRPHDLAVATGIPLMTIKHVASGQRATVYAQTWSAVRDAYRALAATSGPAPAAAVRAAAEGWEPPAAWDEDTIEDPAELTPVLVDEVAVERAVAGRAVQLAPAERDLAIPRMAAAGMSDSVIAGVLGVVPETVMRNRKRLGVPGVLAPHVRAAREARAS